MALGEARKLFATSRNVAGRIERSTGLQAEVLPHPPQELPYRCDGYEDFVLSVNRLDRAKRIDLLVEAAAARPEAKVVIAGDGPDRERLEGIARRHGLDGRIRFAGRVSDEELTDLYARCRAVFYAPVDEDYGMVPYEAFLSEKPVVTTTDAGGPLEVVSDRRDRARRRARPGGARRGAARLGAGRGSRVGSRRQGDRRAGHLGLLHRRAALVKVAYYSPLPPSRSGIADYSALLLPALRERVDVVVVEPGKNPAADVALYHVGNDPDAHGWIVDALCERPGVVVLHDYVLHHLIAGMTIGRGDGRAYLAAMERELGVVGRLLGLGVLDNLLPLLWETRPEDYPLAGTVLDRGNRPDRPLGLRRAGGHGRRATAARSGAIPHPAWPPPQTAAEDIAGDPLIGCFGHLNMNKRIPQLLEAFARLRRSGVPAHGSCS